MCIFRWSRGSNVSVPIGEAVPLLGDYLCASAQRLPDKIGLVCGSRKVTYTEIMVAARKLAWALRRRGVARGDRVLVLGQNSVEAVVAFWGILEASAVAVIVNPSTKRERVSWLLNDCRPSAVIGDVRHVAALASPGSWTTLPVVFVLGGCDGGGLGGGAGVVAFDAAILSERSDCPPPRECIDIDLAALIYTSGSTGEPKGVMLTHRNMLSAAASICQYRELREDDVILNALPLAFDYGLYQMLMSVRQGARLVLEPSFQLPVQVLSRAAVERVTIFPGVPTIFAVLAQIEGASEFLTAVRLITSTGSALPVNMIDKLRGIFPNGRIFSMYGLTECKRCSYLPPEDLERKPGSVGIAIPNTELWLVDENNCRVRPGQVGQLVVRGATVMRGYWEKPGETAKVLRPGQLPGEQVLYTGDYCRLDEESYLYFVGRMDDVIKSRGEKVAPTEVEAALCAVAGVKDVVVVGVPDSMLGEAIEAFVVLEEGAAVTENDLRRECFKRLESFMVPSSIKFRSFLPRSNSGKLNRADLIKTNGYSE